MAPKLTTAPTKFPAKFLAGTFGRPGTKALPVFTALGAVYGRALARDLTRGSMTKTADVKLHASSVAGAAICLLPALSFFGSAPSVNISVIAPLTVTLEARPELRARELAWRRANADRLQREYAGQWLVLEGETIIAHGSDPLSVLREAKTKKINSPYIFRVESHREKVAWLGL